MHWASVRTRSVGLLVLLILGSTVFPSGQSGVPLALAERPGGDFVQAAVADGTGGVWIAGRSEKGLATTPDALHRIPLNAGSYDVFLSQVGADGGLLYAT